MERDFVDELETWLETAMPDSAFQRLSSESQARFMTCRTSALQDLRRGVGLYGDEKMDFAFTLGWMREIRLEVLNGDMRGTEDVSQDDEIENMCRIIEVQES